MDASLFCFDCIHAAALAVISCPKTNTEEQITTFQVFFLILLPQTSFKLSWPWLSILVLQRKSCKDFVNKRHVFLFCFLSEIQIVFTAIQTIALQMTLVLQKLYYKGRIKTFYQRSLFLALYQLLMVHFFSHIYVAVPARHGEKYRSSSMGNFFPLGLLK